MRVLCRPAVDFSVLAAGALGQHAGPTAKDPWSCGSLELKKLDRSSPAARGQLYSAEACAIVGSWARVAAFGWLLALEIAATSGTPAPFRLGWFGHRHRRAWPVWKGSRPPAGTLHLLVEAAGFTAARSCRAGKCSACFWPSRAISILRGTCLAPPWDLVSSSSTRSSKATKWPR
jgi:hypothetical protein